MAWASYNPSPQRLHERGFSIVELMIVLTILAIVLAITVPGYRKITQLAREDTLREDLRVMRKAIGQFAADRERSPGSLEDLVEHRYITEIPVDPMTGSAETWEVILEDETLARDGERGIEDVKSGSTETGSDGTPYSEW